MANCQPQLPCQQHLEKFIILSKFLHFSPFTLHPEHYFLGFLAIILAVSQSPWLISPLFYKPPLSQLLCDVICKDVISK